MWGSPCAPVRVWACCPQGPPWHGMGCRRTRACASCRSLRLPFVTLIKSIGPDNTLYTRVLMLVSDGMAMQVPVGCRHEAHAAGIGISVACTDSIVHPRLRRYDTSPVEYPSRACAGRDVGPGTPDGHVPEAQALAGGSLHLTQATPAPAQHPPEPGGGPDPGEAGRICSCMSTQGLVTCDQVSTTTHEGPHILPK